MVSFFFKLNFYFLDLHVHFLKLHGLIGLLVRHSHRQACVAAIDVERLSVGDVLDRRGALLH